MKGNIKIWRYFLMIIGFAIIFTISCEKNDNDKKILIVKDVDGNVYDTIHIGAQVWMKQNLKVTHYRNGDPIITGLSTYDWCKLTSGAYCSYENDNNYAKTYGYLYNWYAVKDERNIAPIGWHIPSDDEWRTLVNFLIANGYNYDGTTVDNKIAKSLAANSESDNYSWWPSMIAGDVGYLQPSNNKSGFTALPGGERNVNCTFENLKLRGCWWSTTEVKLTDWPDIDFAKGYLIDYDANGVYAINTQKMVGYSIRCIKD
jgi:uncharacterized protein (TIGR02145 family)